MEFDFDEWARLAHSDSAEFERRRRELIEQQIAAAPADLQARLRGLQFRIDMERRRATTPLSACVRLNSMMWKSFAELRGALDAIAKPSAPGSPAEKPGALAKILDFRRRSENQEK